MPGDTFTLSEYPFDWIELACDRCNRRGRLRKARLIEQYGADYGVDDPCRAHHVGLNEWWERQPPKRA
jgi:hypothetical protein